MPLAKQEFSDRIVYSSGDPSIEFVIYKDNELMNISYKKPYPDGFPGWESYVAMIDEQEGL